MGSQEKANSFGKIISFGIIVLVIFSAFYLFISKDNNAIKDDSHDTAIQEMGQNEEILGIESNVEDVDNTTDVDENYDRQIIVYNDKNFNGVKDSDEIFCDICVGKYLNGARLTNGIAYPSYDKFLTFPVKAGGIIKEDDIGISNHVWGYFYDREVIIPHIDIFLGDSTDDIYIPAWEYSLEISGTNAMLEKGDVVKSEVGKYTIKYILTDLVPILSQKFEDQDDIYVYFIPDETKLDVGYLIKGSIEIDEEGMDNYFIELTWPFVELNKSVLEPENLSLVML